MASESIYIDKIKSYETKWLYNDASERANVTIVAWPFRGNVEPFASGRGPRPPMMLYIWAQRWLLSTFGLFGTLLRQRRQQPSKHPQR